MCAAIDNGTFSKNDMAFKLTCKALDIKYTYKAIQEYFQSDTNEASDYYKVKTKVFAKRTV